MGEIKAKKQTRVNVTDSFWRKYMKIVRDGMIPFQWEALNDRVPDAPLSHAMKNFKIAAGEEQGEFYGMVFQDSDVAKWLEAVAYSLETDPNPELEKIADEVIDLLEKAQQEDGYLNTYFTIKEPEKRWASLRDNHELYCAGHFIEAAVAYYHATGKRKFLDIMCRFADYIDSVFGKEDGKLHGYPGHQEIELALVKLYQATGEERYLNLSRYFIDERGKEPNYFVVEREKNKAGVFEQFYPGHEKMKKYNQSHKPVREQTEAVGHAVRAVYMYAAMADLACHTGDESLIKACYTLWENVVQKQMYITAGIGSNVDGESFSFDYDLPNDLAYSETCASIGLVFWAKRMLELEADAQFADVMERALYNGTISGMDLDGKRFFYVNPLEVSPKKCERREKQHVKPVRQKWFGCACCPPNLARLIASIGRYIYSLKEDTVFVHLYIANEHEVEINGNRTQFRLKANYPWDGDIELSVDPETESQFTVALRLPGWCRNATLAVNDERIDLKTVNQKGYLYIQCKWKKGDRIYLRFAMPVERIKAHPNVKENAGKVALQRGPVVYCLEEQDNGANLHNIFIPRNAKLQAIHKPDLLNGVTVITGQAERIDESTWGHELYKAQEPKMVPTTFTAIPYYSWCNRQPGEMIVWVNETK